MLELWLIRHGMTEGNKFGRYIGVTDEPLCQEGIQALEGLKYPDVQKVFSSPMKRCLQTAEILFPEKEPELLLELAECNFGLFENKNYKELDGCKEYQAWIDSNGTLPFPGGESREEFRARSLAGLEKVVYICSVNHISRAAVVTHGGTIMNIMEAYATEKRSFYDWHVKNGKGYHILFDEEKINEINAKNRNIIVVRGGGDLATGVIHRLHRCGYRVLILECEKPSAIRRMVSFCDAAYDGTSFVEGLVCQKVNDVRECEAVWEAGEIPLLIDPKGESLKVIRPKVVIDAIIAKKNLGTTREMAPLTIALGPGFAAGFDVDYVIETKRGHHLGRIIEDGEAIANTGVPGEIDGVSKERVIHSPAQGTFKGVSKIADIVEKDQIIAYVDETPVKASITGVLRGIIKDGYVVSKGMKIADIDPRKEEKNNCYTISDKARCLAGSVVEILLFEGVYPIAAK